MSFGLVDELKREGFEGTLLENEPLSRHTSYRIGGPAQCLACPKSDKDLLALSRVLASARVPYCILGSGSNTLAPDDGFQGCAIKLSRFDATIELKDSNVWIGAGAQVSSLLREAMNQGWGGLECIAGIPGSLGGVVAMNGGTHLGELAQICEQFEVFSLKKGESRWVKRNDFQFSYRSNRAVSEHELVTRVVLRVKLDESSRVRQRIEELMTRRKKTQPLEYPSCGSVFKNPSASSLKAWEIVERLGLRGALEGGAQISEKHPNWIVNIKEARASDVLALIDRVRSKAHQELGIELEPEIKILRAYSLS